MGAYHHDTSHAYTHDDQIHPTLVPFHALNPFLFLASPTQIPTFTPLYECVWWWRGGVGNLDLLGVHV